MSRTLSQPPIRARVYVYLLYIPLSRRRRLFYSTSTDGSRVVCVGALSRLRICVIVRDCPRGGGVYTWKVRGGLALPSALGTAAVACLQW